jgi:hypothetical protein
VIETEAVIVNPEEFVRNLAQRKFRDSMEMHPATADIPVVKPHKWRRYGVQMCHSCVHGEHGSCSRSCSCICKEIRLTGLTQAIEAARTEAARLAQ